MRLNAWAVRLLAGPALLVVHGGLALSQGSHATTSASVGAKGAICRHFSADSATTRAIRESLGSLAGRVEVGVDVSLEPGAASFQPDSVGRLALSPEGVGQLALTHERLHVLWAAMGDSLNRILTGEVLAEPLDSVTGARVWRSLQWTLVGLSQMDAPYPGSRLSRGLDMARLVTGMVAQDSTNGGYVWRQLDALALKRRAFSRTPQSEGWTWKDELASVVASEIDAYRLSVCRADGLISKV